MANKNKFKEIFKELNLIKDNNENSTLLNLTKIPKKDSKNITPFTTASKAFITEQADILYLPEDNGYKYLLVVVDIGTRLTDAEPIKTRGSNVVRDALKTIFKRGIVKKPKRLEVDSGSEFKDHFKTYWEKYLEIMTKVAGRHRQQAVVENKNQQIGKILNTRMLAEEINNKEVSRSWVDIVPKVVQLINRHFSHPASSPSPDSQLKTNKSNQDVLPEGTPVRVQLDNPQSLPDGKRLHGKFRTGDIRWRNKVEYITRFYLRPAQPPMYQVDNNINVAYTKNQLQVVSPDEVKPSYKGQQRIIVEKIIKKLKKSGKVYYTVKWADGTVTDEPRTNLIIDVPQIVKDFERSSKHSY